MSQEKLNAARYEYVRRLSPAEFAEIFRLNLKTGRHFDDLIDDRRNASAGEDALTLAEHPPLGTDAWLNSIDLDIRERAARFAATHHRVEVHQTDESVESGQLVWAVEFVDTGFWADVFPTKAQALAYADAWNSKCAQATKPA